jgi:hypothetical protein
MAINIGDIVQIVKRGDRITPDSWLKDDEGNIVTGEVVKFFGQFESLDSKEAIPMATLEVIYFLEGKSYKSLREERLDDIFLVKRK